MELDCESELTPLLSTRLKEPIHSGAKFFLKVKFVFNDGDFTKSAISEVSCLWNFILNLFRICHIIGWILIRICGSYLFVQNSALIVEWHWWVILFYSMKTNGYRIRQWCEQNSVFKKQLISSNYVMHICDGKYKYESSNCYQIFFLQMRLHNNFGPIVS